MVSSSRPLVPRLALHSIGALLFGVLLAVGCQNSEGDPIVVRLDGPTTPVLRDDEPDDSTVRFAFANVLLSDRSSLSHARFASYLMGKLHQPVEVVRRRTHAELNELLKRDSADVGIVGAGAYAVGHEEFGLQLLVVPTVEGRASLQGLIIARRGEGRESFDDLRGTVFAFADPLSNTGYRYVAAKLHDRDTNPGAFFSRTFYTYSHDNTVQAVRDGIADAGAVDSLIWHQMLDADPRLSTELVIIDQSEDYPIDPVVASPRAPADLVSRLARVLIEMSQSGAGRDVLGDLGLSGFVRLPDSAYDPIISSWRELGALPETAYPE